MKTTMTHEDPRLTAYVLNEAGDAERKAVEAAMAADPALAAEVAQLQAAAQQMRSAFAGEVLPPVPDALHERVTQLVPGRTTAPFAPRRYWRQKSAVAVLAVAATVAASLWAPQLWRSTSLDMGAQPMLEPKRSLDQDQPMYTAASAPVDSPPLVSGSPSVVANTGAKLATRGGAPGRLLRSSDDEFMRVEAPMSAPGPAGEQLFNTERYQSPAENRFELVTRRPLSTFGIDVDTASYSNARRFLLQQHQLPPKESVRVEELINYFSYDDAPPTDGTPFAVHTEVAGAPWAPQHRLLRVTLKGKDVAAAARPASNLVFLLDVSGSMDEPNKLPLVKRSLKLLVDQLSARDRVALVVYAGSSGLVLPATPGHRKSVILDAIEHLDAGGSTNGGAGIMLAYQTARANFIKDGVNRVVLATDGDFNVGVTGDGALTRLVAAQAKSGIFLSVLGFGMGNYHDAMLEQLADKGNGNYAYIDTLAEARKVLVQQGGGTLVTIAKDVKLQVEFNPRHVAAYRLIGYENRLLRDEEFHDDAKDSGDLGAGHTVTALYELIPPGQPVPQGAVDALKYQPVDAPKHAVEGTTAHELLTVKLRAKAPTADTSALTSVTVTDAGTAIEQASANLRFAAAVAEFGMLLTGSEFKGASSFDQVRQLAQGAIGTDPHGLRAEFVNLVEEARVLSVR